MLFSCVVLCQFNFQTTAIYHKAFLVFFDIQYQPFFNVVFMYLLLFIEFVSTAICNQCGLNSVKQNMLHAQMKIANYVININV